MEFLTDVKRIIRRQLPGSIIKAGAIVFLISAGAIPPFSHADGIYKWTDEKGKTHYSSKAPAPGATPVSLPPVKKESFTTGRGLPQSCNNHGGINCAAGPDADGSVICLDNFRDAVNRFNFSCLEARLDIAEVKEKTAGTEYSVFVRNTSGVEVQSPSVTYESQYREKIELSGPPKIDPYGVGEFRLNIRPGLSKPAAANLTVSCLNCP